MSGDRTLSGGISAGGITCEYTSRLINDGPERETLIRALEDCPDDPAEFRGTLLRDPRLDAAGRARPD